MIAAGSDIDFRLDEHAETTLQEAVSCYDFSLTELLVEAGASPDGVGVTRRSRRCRWARGTNCWTRRLSTQRSTGSGRLPRS
jgi:hypothetical protein